MLRKVLIIDDSQVIRYKYQLLLEKYGCPIVTACDGREGLVQMDAHSDIDLVLLGIHMPVLEGLEFLKQVRLDKRHDQVAIVLLANKGQEETVLRAFSFGAQGFVRKFDGPGTLDNLIDRITTGFASTWQRPVASMA